jgi:hypothetical protein
MSGFKDTTRTMRGHHNWSGGTVGSNSTGGTIDRLARGGAVLDKIDSSPGHAEIYPREGNRAHGNAAVQRKEAPTQELTEHGGRGPLTAGFKKGGHFPAKHFHVHKHYHAKGGRAHTVSHSYSAAEKHAETYADGGHVHDSTHVPAGGPDYKRGGKTKPVRKNAGGALYGPGGAVLKPGTNGVPLGGSPALGTLARLAVRPQGLPVRGGLPMRRQVAMAGPQPVMHAKGGKARGGE